MDLIFFMEKRLKQYEKAGDHIRAAKLRITIRDFRAMVEAEKQQSLFAYQ